MNSDITGKELLDEFENFLIDTSYYLYKVGKRIYVSVKNAIKKSDDAPDANECAFPVEANGNTRVAALKKSEPVIGG